MTPPAPSHLIYYGGTIYKTLRSLVNYLSAENFYVMERGRNPDPGFASPCVIYFLDHEAIDLADIMWPIIAAHLPAKPPHGYSISAEEKTNLTAWRAQVRRDLQAELEARVPFPYQG